MKIKRFYEKTDVKFSAMLVALVVALSGLIMVLVRVPDPSHLKIETSFFEATLETGLAGITLFFLAFLLASLIVLSKKTKTKIDLNSRGNSLHWEGYLDTFEKWEQLARIIQQHFGYDNVPTMQSEDPAQQPP